MGFGGGALVASPLSRQLLGLYDSGYDPNVGTSVAGGGALVALFLTLGIGYFVIMMFGVFNIRVPRRRLDAGRASTRRRCSRRPLVTTAQRVGGERDQDAAVLAAVGRAVLQRHRGHRHPRAGQPDDPGLLPRRRRQVERRGRGGGRVRRPAVDLQHGRPVRLVVDVRRHRPQADLRDVPRRRHRRCTSCWPPSATPARRCSCCWPRSSSRSTAAGSRPFRRTCGICSAPIQVGAIHGRLLTAWSAAGIAGPLIINGFLDREGKPGTLTAAAYRPALFTMVGVLAVGFVANLLIRPVAERFHEKSESTAAEAAK